VGIIGLLMLIPGKQNGSPNTAAVGL